MGKVTIPIPVLTTIGEVVGRHYFNHGRIESLFYECGAKGEPPQGSCVNKSVSWLKQSNDDPSVDVFALVGGVLQEFMELDAEFSPDPEHWKKQRERVQKILQQYGLFYQQGGRLIGANVASPTRSLESILRGRDLDSVKLEFERALGSVETDPPAALTAACAILESLFKVYIQDEKLPLPSKETVKPLWAIVQVSLGLNPAIVEDEDLKKILSGLSSIIDGIGSLRTHVGSAHGRGRSRYAIQSRHARLAIHSAHTLCMFLIETWDERLNRRPK